MENHYFFLLQNIVDESFKTNSIINHDIISTNFQSMLEKNFTDDQFAELLIYSGYIPDSYEKDSSQETLFSKLIEVLVCEWAKRMGFSSRFIKQKASYEDVNIVIDNKVIVCDAKSFRLGRSQKAPNVKDFLKLEDIRKWMARYPNKLGGLVTYPCTHDWSSGSDAYQYCSDKSAPTVMLPYKYLSYLLKTKSNYSTTELSELWDYSRIFPNILPKKMKGRNKKAYWSKIDSEILNITHTTSEELHNYILQADQLIKECIQANLERLEYQKGAIITEINNSINTETDINKLKEEIIEYKIAAETGNLTDLINRIKNFRL